MPSTRRDLVRILAGSVAAAALPTVAVADAAPADVPSLPDGILGGCFAFFHEGTGWHLLDITDDAATEPELRQAVVTAIVAMLAAGVGRIAG